MPAQELNILYNSAVDLVQKSVKGKAVERIKFTEVTKKAVEEALHNPRAISQAVVESYKARRALDFLVGFGISPVLWRKVSGSKSAGEHHASLPPPVV